MISKKNLKSEIKNLIDELYLPEEFPLILFPEIHTLLSDLFFKEIFNRSGDQNLMTLVSIARKRLGLNSLIKNNPEVIVLIYRFMIKKYLLKKLRNKKDIDDVVQEVLKILLEKKMKKIVERFDFEFSKGPTFTSYFMVTIRNIYIDMLRKKEFPLKRVENNFKPEEIEKKSGDEMFGQMVLKEEFIKLRTLLTLYRNSGKKIIMTLKIKYRQQPYRHEIISEFQNCSEKDIRILSQNFSLVNEKKIFEVITPIYNRYSAMNLKPDSLRKWISAKTVEITDHMNSTHENNPYNSRNISDLFLLFFNYMKDKGRIKNVS